MINFNLTMETSGFYCITWILHESEAFICKALKGEAIVYYAEPLITQPYESLRLARRVKINEIKSTIILFAYLGIWHCCSMSLNLLLFNIILKFLINFHARFKYEILLPTFRREPDQKSSLRNYRRKYLKR